MPDVLCRFVDLCRIRSEISLDLRYDSVDVPMVFLCLLKVESLVVVDNSK